MTEPLRHKWAEQTGKSAEACRCGALRLQVYTRKGGAKMWLYSHSGSQLPRIWSTFNLGCTPAKKKAVK